LSHREEYITFAIAKYLRIEYYARKKYAPQTQTLYFEIQALNGALSERTLISINKAKQIE